MNPGDDDPKLPADFQPVSAPVSRTGGWTVLVLVIISITVALVGSFVLLQQPDDEREVRSQRIEQLQIHLKKVPGDASARLKLAAEFADRQPDLALSQLRRISPESREYPLAQREVTRLLFVSGANSEAIEAFERLWESSPNDGDLAALGAKIHLAQRHVRTAQNLARRAVVLEPERSDLWLLLAEVYQKSNKDFRMIEPLEEALKRDPENYQAHLLMAIARHASGQMPEASREAAWCHEHQPADVRPMQLLAEIARDEGQFELAEQYVHAALQLDPRDVLTRIVESDLLMFRRQPELAYERLSEIRNDAAASTFRFIGALERAAAAAGRLDEAKELAKDLDRRQDATRPPASEKRTRQKFDTEN